MGSSSSSSIIGVLLQSMMVVQQAACARHLELSDVVISPKVGHFRWDRMGRADELFAAGYEAGLQSIGQIRQVLDSAANKEAQRKEMLA